VTERALGLRVCAAIELVKASTVRLHWPAKGGPSLPEMTGCETDVAARAEKGPHQGGGMLDREHQRNLTESAPIGPKLAITSSPGMTAMGVTQVPVVTT
jgi:hypothetical protein